MAKRDRPHIIVSTPADVSAYRPHGHPVTPKPPPSPPDRAAHGKALRDSLQSALDATLQRRAALGAAAGAPFGVRVVFESPPGVELKLDRLDVESRGIELLAVTTDGPVQRAAVLIPEGEVGYFFRRFEDYVSKTTKKGEPRNKEL